jgi:hypothetical protein
MLLKSSLPSTTRHVLLTLSCHVNDAGEPCYPAVDQLCTETGLSKRAVLDALKRGKEEGWIEISKHGFAGQKWNRNEYRIAWPDKQERGSENLAETEKGGAPRAPIFGEGGAPPAPIFDEGGARGAPKAVHHVHLQPPPLYKGFPSSIPKTPTVELHSTAFGRFWESWPKGGRKFAKAQCWRIWKRAGLDVKVEQVMAALELDKCSTQWLRDDGEFVPMPATWLRQARYDRDIAVRPAIEARISTQCCRCDRPGVWAPHGSRAYYCAEHRDLLQLEQEQAA